MGMSDIRLRVDGRGLCCGEYNARWGVLHSTVCDVMLGWPNRFDQGGFGGPLPSMWTF